MRGWTLALLLVTLSAAAYDARAQELKTYEMDEIVVTGSKMPQTPGNVTQKIEIISDVEMESLVQGNGNLAELLSYSPGNFANALSRNFPNWGSSGGLAHTYKGFMLDGLPIDAFVDLMSLDAWAFQRVEDQRGSASVLYPNYLAMDFAGNQSPLAGTANFILRERIEETVTRVGAYYGSFDTRGARVYHQRSTEDLHVFFGAHHESSDYHEYMADTDYSQDPPAFSWLNMIEDPDYEKTKLYMRATYYLPGPAGHRAGVYAHRAWHSGDEGRPNRDFSHAYTTINASYVYPLSEALIVQAKAGYRHYDRLYEDDSFARDPDNNYEPVPESLALRSESGVDSEIIPVDASLTYAHGDNDVLTVGADYQLSTYKTHSEVDRPVTANDAEAMGWGIYAQEEQRLGDLVLRVGARLTGVSHDISLFGGSPPADDANDWTKLLWSSGIRYNVDAALSLYANAGSSFKAPGLKSVGGTIAAADTTGNPTASGHLPNPDLDPESGVSMDVGAEYAPLAELVLGGRLFYVALDDQITQIRVLTGQETQSLSTDINAGTTTTMGFEAEVDHRISEMVSWFGNYTYTTTEIENDVNPALDGAEMNFVPEHIVNAGVRLELPQQVRAVVTAQIFSSINESIGKVATDPATGETVDTRGKLDGYEIINARLEKRLQTQHGSELLLYLEPYNLTNNAFDMPWGFQDTGFSVNGGLTVAF